MFIFNGKLQKLQEYCCWRPVNNEYLVNRQIISDL